MATTILVGSLDALARTLEEGSWPLEEGADVVVVPTAAAFTGMTEAAVALAASVASTERYGSIRVEALMIHDRSASAEPYFAERLRAADAVVLGDGAALHARSVWRDSPVGEAIAQSPCLVAVGSVASVLNETMIDPRGGAPTTGLGYRSGPVVTVPAGREQLARTRALLGESATLCVLGPMGAIIHEGRRWRASGDVEVTRGMSAAEL